VAALLGGPAALALIVWQPVRADPSLVPLLGVTQALTVLAGVAFAGYAALVVLPYVRHRHAGGGDPNGFEWHFLVPCRDEQAVIGDTVRYLRDTFRGAHIWVIDDDSDDSTVGAVRRVRRRQDANIHIVQRQGPNAGIGKAEALNAGYRAIKQWMGRHADPGKAVLVVVDADGRPAPDCPAVCSAGHLLGDADVASVRVGVRMLNRGVPESGARRPRRAFGSALVRLQDIESRTAVAAGHLSRGVCLDGGQLVRMSALDSIAGPDGRPWRGTWRPDLELDVELLAAGWRTGFTVDTHVDRAGACGLRGVLAQRTRRGQGTMLCARQLRRVLAGGRLRAGVAAEITYHLARPWLRLVGTLAYPVPFVLLAAHAATEPALVWDWLAGGAWALFAGYAALGLLPFAIWGPIYRARCDRDIGWWRALGYGLAYALYGYALQATSWRALGRILRGRNTWPRARRRVELEPAKTQAKSLAKGPAKGPVKGPAKAWPKNSAVALDH
jgi:1,2-diacylglycerol 3-beta-glucosyltransferase